MKFPPLVPILLGLGVVGLLIAARKSPRNIREGDIVIISGNAVPTGPGPGGRPALLSTPPVPLTMGTMGGNVHVRIQRVLSPDRAIGVVVAIESTSDVPPFRSRPIPVPGEPTIVFDPRYVRAL